MWNIILECIYNYLGLKHIIECREVCSEWNETIQYMSYHLKEFPCEWSEFVNMYGIRKIFKNVKNVGNVGHRGWIVDCDVIQKINKLWIDIPLNFFFVFIKGVSVHNIINLTVSVDWSYDILNVISKLKWSNLEVLSVITKVKKRYPSHSWNMPKLKNIMIGSNFMTFPLCLCGLPLEQINELSLVSDSFYKIRFQTWFHTFIITMPFIQFSHIKYIRLINVVPDQDINIGTLINAIRQSSITNLCLNPCSIESAVYILNNCRVHLFVNKDRHLRWKFLKFAYNDRLSFVQL